MNLDNRLITPTGQVLSVDLAGITKDSAIRWYRSMQLIRQTEVLLASMVESGEVVCPCHLGAGQEAVAVGVAEHLDHRDLSFGAHRSHSHYLALGGAPEALVAEVLGREAGCCHGMGGSMHLRDTQVGLMGTVPIVGATISIAVGAAFALQRRDSGAISVAFFGDGATEEGTFHESLNLAAMWKAPTLFVCENNLFSSHLHISQRQPFNSTARFARTHGLQYATVDGNDVAAVWGQAAELVNGIRSGGGPALLEAVTYRHFGHVGHREDLDVGVARTEDLLAWKRRDPVVLLGQALVEQGWSTATELQLIDREVGVELADALTGAREGPYPSIDRIQGSLYPSEAEATLR